MAAPIIFSGNFAKLLKPNLDFGLVSVNTGNIDPTTTPVSALQGSLYLSSLTGRLYQKRDTGFNTNWSTIFYGTNTDISETQTTLANNVSSFSNVTGLSFNNSLVRSFQATVSVTILATTNLYETFTLSGIQRGADWKMTVVSNGDNSQINFSILTTGQVQYTSGNYAGFSNGTFHFRATTLGV